MTVACLTLPQGPKAPSADPETLHPSGAVRQPPAGFPFPPLIGEIHEERFIWRIHPREGLETAIEWGTVFMG
jgi:hypothetical protein